MKAHTTGTAGEIFAAKAERHAAGVREHPTAGAEVGAPAPDFAGELARAFVPESAESATVPVPAAMTRPLDPVATRADREPHESVPVADESSQTKMPSAPPSRPVPSARPPSVRAPVAFRAVRFRLPFPCCPPPRRVPCRPRERVRERADLAFSASASVFRSV